MSYISPQKDFDFNNGNKIIFIATIKLFKLPG